MSVTLKNLIPQPGFESKTGWSGGSYSTARALVGTVSFKLTGTASTASVSAVTTSSVSLNPTHIYYARAYGYQESATGGSVGFYWPNAEPSFESGIPLGAAGKWNRYSARSGRSGFTSGSYPFRLDYENAQNAGSLWVDCVMLVDLTSAFGAGKEPDKAWCDDCIPFFEGSATLEASSRTTLQIAAAGFDPNPANINTQTLLAVQVAEQVAFFVPILYQSSEIFSGEV